MIVKGDGTLALAETVATPADRDRVVRPGGQPGRRAVAVGPAAASSCPTWAARRPTWACLQDGRPRVTEQGAEVGGWRTMVRAIDVRTIGLGGDSEIHIGANGRIGVGPQRIVPVALLGARYPEVLAPAARPIWPMWTAAPPARALRAAAVWRTRRRASWPNSARANSETAGAGHRAAAAVAQAGAFVRRAARVLALKRKGLVQIGGADAVGCRPRAGPAAQLVDAGGA